jgi:hypothetical protein
MLAARPDTQCSETARACDTVGRVYKRRETNRMLEISRDAQLTSVSMCVLSESSKEKLVALGEMRLWEKISGLPLSGLLCRQDAANWLIQIAPLCSDISPGKL